MTQFIHHVLDNTLCMLSCFSCVQLFVPCLYGLLPTGSFVDRILQARILQWVTMPSSRGSPQPRDPTKVSCIAGVFFTIWATREAPDNTLLLLLSRFSPVRLCATHRCQPTRLPHPWDSPGKNTGVGWHFLLQCMKVTSESEVAQSCLTLSDPMDCSPPGSSVHGIFQARVLEWGAIAFSEITPYKLSIVFNVLRLPFPAPSHLVNSYSAFTFWTNISVSGKVYMISLNSFCSVIIPL